MDRRDKNLFGHDHRRRQDRIGLRRLRPNLRDRRGVEIDPREQVDDRCDLAIDKVAGVHGAFLRSEEHTSELQSLMRTSYAVFRLKNKTKNIKTIYTQTQRSPLQLSQHT